MRAERGGGACELRGIRLSASGIAHPRWNNGDVTAADADVERARGFFATRGVPWGVRAPVGMPWAHGQLLFRKHLMGLHAADHRPAPGVPGLRVRDDDAAARLHARLGFVETPGFDVYVDLRAARMPS